MVQGARACRGEIPELLKKQSKLLLLKQGISIFTRCPASIFQRARDFCDKVDRSDEVADRESEQGWYHIRLAPEW
jgi:hypothetical protein